MILKPSSFLGRRSNFTSTRSSERLFASSIAYFATFDRSPASFLSGVSDDASRLKRCARLALLVPRLRILLFTIIPAGGGYYKISEKLELLWVAVIITRFRDLYLHFL